MIVLDTNVVSELMRASPNAKVVAWVSSHPGSSLYTTTITAAEILYGLAILPRGRRRTRLTQIAEGIFDEDFRGRVLAFDSAAARAFAEVAAARRHMGRPIAQLDAQIAGIARSRDAGVATRNAGDFEDCEIDVHDPWRD